MTEIIASLVFDSRIDVLPGLRGSKGHDDRHLIYEGGGVLLDLLLKAGKDSSLMHIAGQIFPSDGTSESVSGVTVVIEQGGQQRLTHTNPLGEFTFRMVASERTDLSITLADHTFTVRGLANDEPREWQVLTSAVGE